MDWITHINTRSLWTVLIIKLLIKNVNLAKNPIASKISQCMKTKCWKVDDEILISKDASK